jgi:DNA ligase (NAD+)
VGETVAKKLANHFRSIDSLMKAGYEELTEAEEVGEKIAQSILSWFGEEKNQEILRRLKAAGLQLELKSQESKRISENLMGKSFVVTGVFKNFSRDEIKTLIEEHGGKNIGSISSRTNYILAGENMGPEKRKKSESLGIPIISIDEFLKMINPLA